MRGVCTWHGLGVASSQLQGGAPRQPRLVLWLGNDQSSESGTRTVRTRSHRASSALRTRRQISHSPSPSSHATIAHLISRPQPPSQQLLALVRPCDTRRQTNTAHLLLLLPNSNHHHPRRAASHRIHHTDIHTTMRDLSKHCDALTAPNPFTVSLAGFLVFGILVSYIPQHLKIIQRRSSEGLSPWWVLLGGLSSIAAIGNILTLPGSRADIGCCKELNGIECAAALLGVAQIGIQWSCFMFM